MRAIVVALVIICGAGGTGEAQGSPARQSIEVWNGSPHDALTSKLRDAIESAVQNSKLFGLGYGKKDGTLIATIPSAVKWKSDGKRTRISYSIVFSSIQDKQLGTASGSCWDDNYAECADQVLREASVAARKIQ